MRHDNAKTTTKRRRRTAYKRIISGMRRVAVATAINYRLNIEGMK